MSLPTLTLFCAALLSVNSAHGMDCNWFGSDRILDQLKTCPGLIDSVTNPEKSYCCPTSDISFSPFRVSSQCCDLGAFLLTLVVIAIVICVLFSLISCLCCFLCPFCCIYKRRNGRGCIGIKI